MDDVSKSELREMQAHVVAALRIADAFGMDEGIHLDTARLRIEGRMRAAGLAGEVVDVPAPELVPRPPR